MDILRREQLIANWEKDGDMDWREGPTPEELDFLSSQDRAYHRGSIARESSILIAEKIRARYRPSEILELEAVFDHCRLRLRDGRLFLARLNNDRSLRLDEIDEVC